MGSAGRVSPDQQWDPHSLGIVTPAVSGLVVDGKGVDGLGQQPDVIGGIVGTGVTRPKHRGQWLIGFVQPHPQR